MRRRTRRVLALVAGIVLALLAVLGALAAGGAPTDKVISGTDITIAAGTTVDHDLYAFGSTVTIDGTINGDLVAAAARIVINGTVTGGVFAAASDVTLEGSVGGDFRAAGAQIAILGKVGQDAALAAGTITLGTTGAIGRDLLFTGSEVTLEGNVSGGIAGSATDYTRHGSVGGSEQVSLATKLDQPPGDRTLALALDALRQYIVVLLFGLALLRFAPRILRASADRVRSQPLIAAGTGVVAILGYVAILIALIVLMVLVSLAFGELQFGGLVAIDIVGTLLAALGLSFGLVVFGAFVADAIVGLAIGRLVAISDTSRWADATRLAIGSALVVVLTSFPEVGSIVKLLVVLVALGAISSVVWASFQRPAAAVVFPPPAA